MFDYLAAQIAELKEDDDESVDARELRVESREPVVDDPPRHRADRAEAPVASLEHARHMAARGASIDATLRFYRLGHAWFAERWNAELADRISGRAQLISAVRESAAFSFAYIDVVTAKVSADHVAERDRRQRRAAAVQAERARRVAQLTQRPSPSFTRFEDVARWSISSRAIWRPTGRSCATSSGRSRQAVSDPRSCVRRCSRTCPRMAATPQPRPGLACTATPCCCACAARRSRAGGRQGSTAMSSWQRCCSPRRWATPS
jgi:hypothetical protein